jgi:hypothetical protein
VIGELDAGAVEYGDVARRAFEAAGGDELAPRAEADPARREALVAGALAELGASDLDPRRDPEEAEAAAALCRSAGSWAVAAPIAERLGRPTDVEGDGLLVVDPARPAGRVASLEGRWVAVDLDGRRYRATARPGPCTPRIDGYVAALDLAPLDDGAAADAALGLVLAGWTLLGMLDRAVDDTRVYVLRREQFGKALATFQGVQFQLTDAEVERVGLEELAKYALWSTVTGRPESLDDALVLRAAALQAAETVFRVAHQLHGAIGYCDETPLSWVSRASVPLRRLPYGLAATRAELTRRIGRRGLTGLFGPLEGMR